eukprot:3228215-Prymnesium_polylepis.1
MQIPHQQQRTAPIRVGSYLCRLLLRLADDGLHNLDKPKAIEGVEEEQQQQQHLPERCAMTSSVRPATAPPPGSRHCRPAPRGAGWSRSQRAHGSEHRPGPTRVDGCTSVRRGGCGPPAVDAQVAERNHARAEEGEGEDGECGHGSPLGARELQAARELEEDCGDVMREHDERTVRRVRPRRERAGDELSERGTPGRAGR